MSGEFENVRFHSADVGVEEAGNHGDVEFGHFSCFLSVKEG